ncbi:MAG: redoxin domain-containing protein [Phycisphaerales bacterium]
MSTLKKSVFGALCATMIAAPAFMMGAGNSAESTEAAAAALSIGDTAPDFTLVDYQGVSHTLSDYTSAGNTVVLEWFSPSCPFVIKHYREDTGTMNKIEADNAENNVVWLRINSGHAKHSSADKALNIKTASEWGIESPILVDSSGEIGKKYGAKRTPDMYIIGADQTLLYHGAIDNRSDAAAPGEVNYVANALAEINAGKKVSKAETKPYGCGVKYD